MAHIFKIGDRARVNCPKSLDHGKEVVIQRLNVPVIWEGQLAHVGHEVNIPLNGRNWLEKSMEKKYPFCIFEPHELTPLSRRGDKLTSYDTTATDEATKAMLKAMSGECVA